MYLAPKSALRSPFDGIATHVNGLLTSREVLEASGLNWRVEERPIQLVNGQTITTHKATVRGDTGAILGVVGKGFHPLQNSEVFAFADQLVGEGKLEYVGAGTFNEGKKIFVQCRAVGNVNEGEFGPIEVAKDDVVYPYFLFVNAHDGSSAVNTINTEIRAWCTNSLNAAINSAKKRANTRISVRHTKSMAERMQQAMETFVWAKVNHLNWAKDARALAQKKIDKEKELASYFDAVFEVIPTEDVTTLTKNRRERLVELFETGAGNELPGVRHTRWAAVNAVTQFLGHESRTAVRGLDELVLTDEERNQRVRQKRLESNLFGSNADTADRAFELALSM